MADRLPQVKDVLRPGQFSVHHLGIAHGGGPNNGADRRIGFNVTYITPAVRSVRPEGAFAQLVRCEASAQQAPRPPRFPPPCCVSRGFMLWATLF